MPRRTSSIPSGARSLSARNSVLGTRNSKRSGELAELIFLTRASSLGFLVAKPYGDSAPYDFIVADGPRLSRVQVRSVARRDRGAFHVSSGSGSARKYGYTREHIDALAVYLVPLDTWYIIPIDAFSPIKTLWLRPGSFRRFEPFREAWHWLLRDFGTPRGEGCSSPLERDKRWPTREPAAASATRLTPIRRVAHICVGSCGRKSGSHYGWCRRA